METIKNQLDEPRQLLQTLRDEIKVKLQLASMEARDKWKELDREAEQLIRRAERASTSAFEQMAKKLRELSATIDRG